MGRKDVSRYRSADGRRIYRLPLEVFPGFWGNAYLILGGERPILVDSGSGQKSSNRGLGEGFEQVRSRFGEAVGFRDLGAIVITHGHIDHFGGLSYLAEITGAPVHIHVLDQRVVSRYRERVAMASRHVEAFFRAAGIDEEKRPRYMATYLRSKTLFSQGQVHGIFEEGAILGGELEAVHVPGHCPGQVCLRVADILLTADHVLADITPHLSPEVITRHTGMAHYFESLERISALEGVSVGLGGHGGAIEDLPARLGEIRAHHQERLAHVLDLCREPRRVVDLSRDLFGRVESYHVLLAVLEAGAHIEYLYDRGELVAENAESLSEENPVILYRRV